MGRPRKKLEIAPINPGEIEQLPPELQSAISDPSPPDNSEVESVSNDTEVAAETIGESPEMVPNADTETSDSEGERKQRRSRLREAQARVAELEARLAELDAKAKTELPAISPETMSGIRGTVIDLLMSGWDVITYEQGRAPLPESSVRSWAVSVANALEFYKVWSYVSHPLTILAIQTALMIYAVATSPKVDNLKDAYAGRKSVPIIAIVENVKAKR